MVLRAVALCSLTCGALFGSLLVASPARSAESREDRPASIEIETLLTSDYIYRGVSLSARKPSGAASIEATWQGFYFSTVVESVSFPSNPAAEISLEAGYRRSVNDDVELQLSASYFYYPGEIPSDTGAKSNYWEYVLQLERDKLEESGLGLRGLLAYAPDVSGTGAWGAYAEGEVTFDLPRLQPFKDIAWHLIASAGYWRFGDTSPAQGGFRLPSYANWRLGLEFPLSDQATFDVSYYDTSLSREDCFALTGDTMGAPGGAMNAVSNPQGLRSGLCGAALVATVRFGFPKSK